MLWTSFWYHSGLLASAGMAESEREKEGYEQKVVYEGLSCFETGGGPFLRMMHPDSLVDPRR
jgi:hypothetical protein